MSRKSRKRRPRRSRMGGRYLLLNGEPTNLNKFSSRQRSFLLYLKRLVDNVDRVGYMEILEFALGSKSPALLGGGTLTPEIAASPCYRVAEDMVERAGIKRGLMPFPDSENLMVHYPRDGSYISQQQAADLMGLAWEDFRSLLKSRRLRTFKHPHCSVVVIEKRSAIDYRDKLMAEGRPLPK